VRDQDNPHAIDLALHLDWFYWLSTHDAGPASSWVGLPQAIDGGQASLRYPGAYLPPQFVIGDA
jgi:hypothetical protein